jgi:septum formation protein
MKLSEKYKNKKILLASKSPRRQELLKGLDIDFDIADIIDINEDFPTNLKAEKIASYLSELKAQAYIKNIKENEILITADTIVWHSNKVLNKPKDRAEAFKMISALSGDKHMVFTGVTISSLSKQKTFVSGTKVYFKQLTNDEIYYYIDKYKPFDKAGAYGIQEWIGYIGIEKIEGSYFNVMGLPVQKLYDELLIF